MNQRVRRKSKKNAVEEIHVATGGHVARQDAHSRTSPEPRVPQKTTGDADAKRTWRDRLGFAKGSPTFKETPASELKDQEEQKQALAENTVEKTEEKQDGDETN